MDDEQKKRDAAEFAGKLLGFARTAEKAFDPDVVATAFLSAYVAYQLRYGVSEALIREGLREAADKLELTEPPAPTVN